MFGGAITKEKFEIMRRVNDSEGNEFVLFKYEGKGYKRTYNANQGTFKFRNHRMSIDGLAVTKVIYSRK